MSLPDGTPTAAPPTAAPPAAALAGLDSGDAPGDLGSFTWDGFASESPWIVGPVSGTARPGASLGVVLAPGPALSRWRALWARVTGTGTGTPIDGGGTSSDEGSGGAGRTLVVRAPDDPGRSATWYWRIELRP
jgi:hypothetical protein